MNEQTLESLREALRHSPANIPLKLHLAETLSGMQRFEEAEKEFSEILALQPGHLKAQTGLAQSFLSRKNYSACIVLLESLLQDQPDNLDLLVLHARALLREKSIDQAVEAYRKVLALDPRFTDGELDKSLRNAFSFSERGEASDGHYEQSVFIEKPDINFNHVGGMDQIKREIDLKIIQPLLHPEIYKAYGKKTGGGILLYGPPGCGKTFLAKATAGQVKAQFISVGLNDILDMWIGNSEKNLHQLFEIARNNTPCVLFFDEIDALGASRSDMRKSGGRHLINQFLQELDGVEADNEGILVLGATNAPWHLDQAFRRPGRFDRILFVPPPDQQARSVIFQLKLADKPFEMVRFDDLAKRTADYSGADIEAVIDIAVEAKLEEAIKKGGLQPLQHNDIVAALKLHKPSTKEWFTTAKNYALYANESGLYDDILAHLKLKK